MSINHACLAFILTTGLLLSSPTARSAAISARPNAEQARPAYAAGARFVDVRSSWEWWSGHLKGATHLPVGDVSDDAASILPDKHQPIVTYCAVGVRAQTAAEALRRQGYTNVTAMTGGFDDLKAAGYPVVE